MTPLSVWIFVCINCVVVLLCHIPKDSVIVHDITRLYHIHVLVLVAGIWSMQHGLFHSSIRFLSISPIFVGNVRKKTVSPLLGTFDWSRFHFFDARACLWVSLDIGKDIDLLHMLWLHQSANQWDQAWTKSPSSSSLTSASPTRSGKTIVLAF